MHHKAAIINVWLRYLLFKSAKHEARIFKAFELADYIKIESEGPANLLRGFLKRRNRAHLAEKVVTIYFAVRDVFVTEPVNLQREDLIIVAGRIGAQQKNPALLEKALRRFFDAPASVASRNSCSWRGAKSREMGCFEPTGSVVQEYCFSGPVQTACQFSCPCIDLTL